jgi:muramidase (phage lysozyme)
MTSKWWDRKTTNYVIPRQHGVIPNITKAYDVHVDIPLETMQAATAARADKFCDLMHNLKFADFKNHPFHHTDVTLSVITNPAARVRKSWDWDFQG